MKSKVASNFTKKIGAEYSARKFKLQSYSFMVSLFFDNVIKFSTVDYK
jgi:hypothetical protein